MFFPAVVNFVDQINKQADDVADEQRDGSCFKVAAVECLTTEGCHDDWREAGDDGDANPSESDSGVRPTA